MSGTGGRIKTTWLMGEPFAVIEIPSDEAQCIADWIPDGDFAKVEWQRIADELARLIFENADEDDA